MKPIYKILDWVEDFYNELDYDKNWKYEQLCYNNSPGAIAIIKKNIESKNINWGVLSQNYYAFDLLMENKDKINWDKICFNENENIFNFVKNNQNKIDWKFSFKGMYKIPEISSIIMERLSTRKKVFRKIDWFDICRYSSNFCLLDKYPQQIRWEILSENPNAIHILEKNLDKISWSSLCRNPNAIKLLEENQDKIDWRALSANPNAIDLLDNNYEKVQEEVFSNIEESDILGICGNPNAIHIIEKNLDKLNDRSWILLNSNPNAVHLVERYATEKVCWDNLLENPNALEILKKYKDDKSEEGYDGYFFYIYRNPGIFQLDKVAMKKQIEPFAKELIEKVLHPSRVFRILNEYNYNIVSDEYWSG